MQQFTLMLFTGPSLSAAVHTHTHQKGSGGGEREREGRRAAGGGEEERRRGEEEGAESLDLFCSLADFPAIQAE